MQVGFEITGTNGRSLRVEQDCDRTSDLIRKPANLRDDPTHPTMFGMTHVQSKNIRTVLDQLAQRFGFLRRRAKRTNNFRLSHCRLQDSGCSGKSKPVLQISLWMP